MLSAFYFETNFSKDYFAVYNILLYFWQMKYDIVIFSKVSASMYWIRYVFSGENLVLWLLFHTSNLFIISIIRTTFITDYILSWDNIYKIILLGKWILWSKLKDKWLDMQKNICNIHIMIDDNISSIKNLLQINKKFFNIKMGKEIGMRVQRTHKIV